MDVSNVLTSDQLAYKESVELKVQLDDATTVEVVLLRYINT